jgi:hypothetical protein
MSSSGVLRVRCLDMGHCRGPLSGPGGVDIFGEGAD